MYLETLGKEKREMEHESGMGGFDSLKGSRLRGGYTIVGLEFVRELLVDSIGRFAVAQTQIVGREFHLTILAGMTEQELSVALYHEILEAVTVASSDAPGRVQDFNEGDFERAGYEAHERFGPASREGLDRMLQFYGFQEN